MILCMSVLSVVISPFSFPILLIWFFSLCFKSFQGIVFFSWYMLGVGILGLYGSSVFSVFLRNFHTVFHSVWTSLHSPNSVRGFPSSPHALQHLLFINFLMMAILISMRWHLIAVSVGLSLLMSNAEHLFICLLAICISSLFFFHLFLFVY